MHLNINCMYLLFLDMCWLDVTILFHIWAKGRNVILLLQIHKSVQHEKWQWGVLHHKICSYIHVWTKWYFFSSSVRMCYFQTSQTRNIQIPFFKTLSKLSWLFQLHSQQRFLCTKPNQSKPPWRREPLVVMECLRPTIVHNYCSVPRTVGFSWPLSETVQLIQYAGLASEAGMRTSCLTGCSQ